MRSNYCRISLRMVTTENYFKDYFDFGSKYTSLQPITKGSGKIDLLLDII